MIKRGINNLLAGIMWLVVIALGFWFILVGRNSLLSMLAKFYAGEDIARSMEVRFFEKIYLVIMGLIFAIGMLAVFEYFRFGVGKPDFYNRITLVIGIELILIFLADLGLFWAQSFSSSDPFRWIILFGEFLLGLGLLLLTIRSHKLRKI